MPIGCGQAAPGRGRPGRGCWPAGGTGTRVLLDAV